MRTAKVKSREEARQDPVLRRIPQIQGVRAREERRAYQEDSLTA